MAVFGAPAVHEDDAERAIRAALRVLEAIEELNAEDERLALQARVGINTGEAVVALGARPEEGEGIVTGDVVNTASRLQGAAPVNGVAVSETTFRATERIFDFEGLEPVSVKGKAEPLALYRPLRPRARFGSDVIRTHTTPLVGRELEKQLLIGAYERAMQQHSPQLVTIVGEPGAGKSRLCAELLHHLEAKTALTRWRAGPLPSLWRGDRLLGARGDREGRVRDSRDRLSGGGGRQARPSAPGERSRPRVAQGSSDAARRRRRRARLPGGVFCGLAPRPRRVGRSAADGPRLRGSALGGREPFSPFSSISPSGRRGCRCSCSVPRARSSSSGTPPSVPMRRTPSGSTSLHSRTRRRPA